MISYAHIHCEDESKTYGILNALLPSFTDLFSSTNPDVSIFTTSQLGQLVLQSWYSWSTFPEQDHLYLKFLSGPCVTVVKFSRPPWALSGLPTSPTVGQAESSPPKKRRRVEEEDEQEASPPLHKLIPQKYALELVIWNHHIFADPLDSTCGLSAALRCALHRLTVDIVKGFDQGL